MARRVTVVNKWFLFTAYTVGRRFRRFSTRLMTLFYASWCHCFIDHVITYSVAVCLRSSCSKVSSWTTTNNRCLNDGWKKPSSHAYSDRQLTEKRSSESSATMSSTVACLNSRPLPSVLLMLFCLRCRLLGCNISLQSQCSRRLWLSTTCC